jgi:ADP-ribosylglycohydrolase
MVLPSEYREKVYAGVLGKITGVYLGRPFEGWTNERIEHELGEIRGYVHDRLGVPLVVTDDDISGTFTFFRSLEDHGFRANLTSAEIGRSWLNYIIENKTILWWGGLGMSTEHTAFLRLKDGISAPVSGSIELNGKTVAEQIGAQIFIDAWGLVCPSDPSRAASFAERAARVSHDGEAVYAAQVVASMVALAFGVEQVEELVGGALQQIPSDCLIAEVIADVCAWHASQMDWREAFAQVKAKYGYDKFGGSCHVVPNHALVILALLYGQGDFAESQMIVNTCGWDTDCNAANVGCILGVLRGLAAFEGPVDWRGPVADRMYLPTADGGRCITDALREADKIVEAHCRLNELECPPPKDGARFHFSQPGSLQGFTRAINVGGRLSCDLDGANPRSVTPTFTPPEALKMPGYGLVASPTLYSGQRVRAAAIGGPFRLCIGTYAAAGGIEYQASPSFVGLGEWIVPETDGRPIAEVGIEADGARELDWLSWDGDPTCRFTTSEGWVDAVDHLHSWPQPFTLIQDHGTGIATIGTREWKDYAVSSEIELALCEYGGITARVQGLTRYYALILSRDACLRLVRMENTMVALAEIPFEWAFDRSYRFDLEVVGDRLRGTVDGVTLTARDDRLKGGAIGLVVSTGRIGARQIDVRAKPALEPSGSHSR